MTRSRTVRALAVTLLMFASLAFSASPAAAAARYYYNTWITISSYRINTSGTSLYEVGTLYAGRHYFYCQYRFPRWPYTDAHGNTNIWYASTDDDTGNRGVLIPVTAFTVGGQNEPIPGLPSC
ncbi:hypothetical protein ABZ234_33275 [Nocardiopsis sp. NPDC006198]|uniref:hypothetical protein n=1 Tax=Nocardiopsis sp. NPDC006198 TaxID=3154472 RepID=UPI0033B7EC15